MNKKRKLLQKAILLFMVLSVPLTTSQTFAYWSDFEVAEPLPYTTTTTFTVGEWEQVLQWDPNATYLTGDQVTNNGITYQAKKDNPTREPGVGGGWNSEWTQIG